MGIIGTPYYPPSRVDDVGHARTLEQDTSVRSPWTTEVESTGTDSVTVGGCDHGIVDHEVGGIGVGVAAAGSDVSLSGSEDANLDSVEPCKSSLAEDEVGGTLDIGFRVDLHSVLS